MLEILRYVSSKGWVIKFLPKPNKIVIDLWVVESGIDFRNSIEVPKDLLLDEELHNDIWICINRMNENIKSKLNQAF